MTALVDVDKLSAEELTQLAAARRMAEDKTLPRAPDREPVEIDRETAEMFTARTAELIEDRPALGSFRDPAEPDWVRDEQGSSPAKPPVAGGLLEFHDIADVLEHLAGQPAPQFLARPIWPSDAYGIFGSPPKAGKTWAVADLAVNVAGGGTWLGHFKIERPGPVLIFLGEGGPRKMTRRLAAIAAAYNFELEELPLRLCFRAPHLLNAVHLALMAEEIAKCKPVLVIVDPLYLAARGAQGSQLFEMGAHLEAVQAICQRYGAALMVVHHFNRQEGRGSSRLSGAGPAEWGRVLVMAEVVSKHTDEATGETSVVLDLDFIGDEIPDTTLRIRRKVAALDPDDLASALRYSCEVLPRDAAVVHTDGLTPAHRRVRDVLDAAEGEWVNVRQIGDRLAVDGSGLAPLRTRTIQVATKALVDAGYAKSQSILASNALQWRSVRNPTSEEVENVF